jgi:TfoX/Sxy family transcriptional regulator of competence genes
MTMQWRKSPEALVRRFAEIVPDDPAVQERQMFGYPAAFCRGNLFMSLFQDRVVLRLGDADRAALLALAGAAPFEPMPGRPMREYVLVPPAMVPRTAALSRWVGRSLAYAKSLPPKGARASTGASAKTGVRRKPGSKTRR